MRFAVLVGVGATCVNAYLAQDAVTDRHARTVSVVMMSLGECVQNIQGRL
jgi:glutamate synthase (NADPH/NADH) large chain